MLLMESMWRALPRGVPAEAGATAQLVALAGAAALCKYLSATLIAPLRQFSGRRLSSWLWRGWRGKLYPATQTAESGIKTSQGLQQTPVPLRDRIVQFRVPAGPDCASQCLWYNQCCGLQLVAWVLPSGRLGACTAGFRWHHCCSAVSVSGCRSMRHCFLSTRILETALDHGNCGGFCKLSQHKAEA
jgi:hypothetical protein